MSRWWLGMAWMGCGAPLETTGFDQPLQADGLWVRAAPATGEPFELSLFFLHSRPDRACSHMEHEVFGGKEPVEPELESLRDAVRQAGTQGEECRALVAYHQARLEQVSGAEGDLQVVLGFGDPATGIGSDPPDPGVVYGRRSTSFAEGGFFATWTWTPNLSLVMAELDCAAADAGRAWRPEPDFQRSGTVLGRVTFDTTPDGYEADLSLGFDEGGIVGAAEGRATFELCDVEMPAR